MALDVWLRCQCVRWPDVVLSEIIFNERTIWQTRLRSNYCMLQIKNP
jgi:hypothetical protein